MGLMYIFPVSLVEGERSELLEISANGKPKKSVLILKTYGLPMIFWGYLAASFVVIAAMWLASSSAITKLVNYEDTSLWALGQLVRYTLILTPLTLLAFFFYEKHIQKSGTELKLIYKIFFITVYSKTLILDSAEALSVDHFMDSPNIAKIHNKAELKQFENKGYFELHALSNKKSVFIDRHSRKADLLKMKELLSKY
ncbi:MAG: hypothetical protein Q7U04_15920 [Bacteriovorax sp.]|nr:hypothetical protein [Bacteriovorax sp.]